MSRLRYWIAGGLVLASIAAAAGVTVLASTEPGHRPLHIGCTDHNHGPARTAGEGRRLLDARALNRRARQQQP